MLWKVVFTLLIVLQYAAANLPHTVSTNYSRNLNATAGYCNEKQLTNVNRTVTTTREVSRKKGIWPFRRTVKDIEYSNETVPHTIWPTVLRCCEGYQMNEQQHCVAQCNSPCPVHADCIFPNICRCQPGYKEIRETTDAQESAALLCLLPSIKVETEVTETTTEYNMDYESSTWETSTDKSLEATDDCRVSDCPEYAKCLENGTCACLEGYTWHEQRSHIPNEPGMQLDMFCLHENYSIEARDASTDSFSGFLFKVLSILSGVALIVGLAAIIIWRYKKQQQHIAEINVENGKITDKNIHCKYVSDNEEASVCVVY